ncbi:MAG: lyase family protein [Thermoplasmata archaeon]
MDYYDIAKKYYLETNHFIDERFLKNIVIYKMIASKTNFELKLIDEYKYKIIENSCKKILENSDYEKILVFQTGSGTGINMKINDLIVKYAKKYYNFELNPNDDVNKSQSSNDVIPSILRITLYLEKARLLKNIQNLIENLEKYSKKYKHYLKPGRTHLRDALPVTFGLELFSYHIKLDEDYKNIIYSFENLKELPVGGTAVGTGILSHENFKNLFIKNLNSFYNSDFVEMKDPGKKMKFVSDITFLLNSISNFCLDIIKISNDFRLMFSGPFSGMNEIYLKNMEIEGSSIMPGKINPVNLESIILGCTFARNLSRISEDSSLIGEFELSMSFPLQMYISIQALDIAAESAIKLSKFLDSFVPNRKRSEYIAIHNPEIFTILRERLPYKDVSKIIKNINEKNINQIFKKYKINEKEIKRKILDLIDKIY